MLSKMKWGKLHIIIMNLHRFYVFWNKIINYISCVHHKILDTKCEVCKLNDCNYRSNETNCHNSSEHWFLINFKHPLTLKLFIYFSLSIEPVLIFNINKWLLSLNYELIWSTHLKNWSTCIVVTVQNLHYNGLNFCILNNF